MSIRILALLALVAAAPAAAQTRWYVDADATGAATGQSWTDAFPDLQAALAAAASGDEVWVAGGVYRPGTTRSATFALPDGVLLFGGFDGTETQRHTRDWAAHETVLSGDLGVLGQASDNAYHVVTAQTVGDGTLLDGFVVESGNANGNPEPLGDAGGGLFLRGASPVLQNLIVRDNAAPNGAGLLARDGSGPLVVNALFYGNLAGNGGGAVAAVGESDATFVNVTASENVATEGGALYVSGSTVRVRNAILWENQGGEIASLAGSNVMVERTIVEGGYAGPFVLDSNPQFIDPDANDFTLADSSPGLDFADADFLPHDHLDLDGDGDTNEVVPYDLGHGNRISFARPELGAFERSDATGCPQGPVLFVHADADGIPTGNSWIEAYPTLSQALSKARDCDYQGEFWIAEGTYTPSDTDPTLAFELESGWAFYGGFDGTEVSRNERDWSLNLTILSGSILSPSQNDDTEVLIRAVSVSPGTILDGFVIERSSQVGIYMNNSALRARHLTVRDHRSFGIEHVSGSAHIDSSRFERSRNAVVIRGGVPSVRDCQFENNGPGIGAAITHLGGSMDAENIQLYGNTSTTLHFEDGAPTLRAVTSNNSGLAVLVEGGSPHFEGFTIEQGRIRIDNGSPLFTDVESTATGTVLEITGGTTRIERMTSTGGRFEVEQGSALFIDLAIEDALRSGSLSAFGGGAYFSGGAEVVCINCRFLRNTARASEFETVFAIGGGFAVIGADVWLVNSLVAKNKAEAQGRSGSAAYGDGLAVYEGTVTLINSTIVDNDDGMAVYAGTDGIMNLGNSIIWNHASSIGRHAQGIVTATHSLVEGGYSGGTHILDADPLFEAVSNYHLQPGSPAIDFGDSTLLPPDSFDLDGDGDTTEPLPLDLEGNARILGTSVDLGAYESPFSVATEPEADLPTSFRLHNPYPNPFTQTTRLTFDLPEAAEVTVTVFDALGRAVRHLTPGRLAAGAGHSVVLDGIGLPSGLYLYRLTVRSGTERYTASGTLTHLR